MRNLTPGPKLSLLIVAVLLITLAVCPIGCAQTEAVSGKNQQEKRNAEDISQKQERSADFGGRTPDRSAYYQKWDDDVYFNQLDPPGSNNYEDDGYGYDDDEYDHFNYKRYDSDKKSNEDMKMSNEESKGALMEEKRANVVVPEATTIELLSFQSKNMNPMSDNLQIPKDDSKMKSFSIKKPYSEKSEDKDALVDDKLKKKTTTEEQKTDGNASDKNTGNVKVAESKLSEVKEASENKAEKGKVSDTTESTSVQKENAEIASSKENSVSVSEVKNDAKISEKDLKSSEDKLHQDDKGGMKMKGEKDMEARIDEVEKEKSVPDQAFDNMNDPVIADDEQGSEDIGMNLAGLRDSRNELPYQYPNGFRPGKYVKKKESPRGAQGMYKWDSKAYGRQRGGKEPFHLDFPVGDLENADYRHGYLKGFKNMGDSAHILSQGDAPSPYADDSKKYLAPKVIEEEQRKRRSRLRRLKPNPMFASIKNRETEEEEEEADTYDYGPPRMQYGMYRRNTDTKTYRRRGSNAIDDLDEEVKKNVKNKRQDDAGFAMEDAFAEKRKSQGKSSWEGNSQKKKLKDGNTYDEASHYNTPLVLLQKTESGQAVKTFVDGRYKNEEGVDSEDLARLLSRDRNYVVLKKVPGKDEVQEVSDNGNSKSSIVDTKKDKLKVTHGQAELTVKAQHDGKESESALKPEGNSMKRKGSKIEDLSDFFKGDPQDDKDLDEKKEMLMSIDNRISQFQRGEPNKKVMYKPSLSQAYRHMKDLDEAESSIVRFTEKKTPERLLKSFKKDGKEFLVVNKPFNTMYKGKSQDALGVVNVAPNPGNPPQSAMYQNSMMPGTGFQEIKLPEVQKEANGRNYFLYGSENGMSTAPKHEIKVVQGAFGIPADSPFNYNPLYFNSQNYNKASPMKNTPSGRAQSLQESPNQYLLQQNVYSNPRQCPAKNYQQMSSAEGFKRITKKDKSSAGLERFMRDFQDFSQASYPTTYKSMDLPGMSLQELTGHGGRHLQKLNSLLKEMMNSKGEESMNSREVKNLKRGMFQKYKDQKNWPLSGDAQVRAGKWTSVVYDGSSQGYPDKIDESAVKDRKIQGKDASATLNKDTLLSKRTKRQAGYDSKDSTKILEQKVKSTPYNVQPQPLFPTTNNAGNTNANQQHKAPSRACLQLPPDKLMDLLSFFRSGREEFDKETNMDECLCRRSAPVEETPGRRKLLSVEDSPEETQKQKEECVRRSFQSYLDPLVRKLEEYDSKTEGGSANRDKREIELDESMPNDFQNFLVTSLGSFGNQKRGVVKKDEALWDLEGSHEGSTLGKRDTRENAKTEKKSVSKEDATNIRIKIVDGNGNGDLDTKALEGGSKVAGMDSDHANVHELYLITNSDSKRNKKKFASIRSDQGPQKQPISNHLPQVETVYNPSPGSNKAQVEKISGDTQMKGKCAPPTSVYNATASMMEDNIIRNNLRTGNINTFTYQHTEEPTPYPLQGPTNPPSGEFERLNSKSMTRSKPFGDRLADDRYGTPEIVYKDQKQQQYGLSMTSPGYNSNPMVRVIQTGVEGAERKEEDDAEYEDGESYETSERQDYEERDAGRQESRRQDDFSKSQEHLDPKMVALWNDYARTHLSPERHKEAMEREFQEAYFRSSGQSRYVGGNLNFMPNLNDFERLEKTKTGEKLSKRYATASEPVQIGKRFFYTFKSEIPDEEYYSLYQQPSQDAGKSRLSNQPQAKAAVKRDRVKRSDETESSTSSGHPTDNRYRKYHQKTVNEEEEERKKRDSLADFLKADMMRRIEEEKKIRSKVKGLSSDLTKYDIPLMGGMSGEEVSLPDLLLQKLEEDERKKEGMPYLENQQNQENQQQAQPYGNAKSGLPDVFKTIEIKRGRREEGRRRARDDTYEDRVFLKGVKTRKVKEYSNEGFEPLTPDASFFEKSSFYSSSDGPGPYRIHLDESASSSVHRRAGEKSSKAKQAAGQQQKLQKLTHGFSHEAPLLTVNSPLNSPKIFEALKDGPLPKDEPSLRKHPLENALLTSADTHDKASKAKEPLVSAVLVVTKREDSEDGRAESMPQPSFRLVQEADGRPSTMEKREAEWLKDAEDEISHFRPAAAQSPEIVNEEGDGRNSECETPAPPTGNKNAENVKQSSFPFRRLHNDRNEGGNGIGNSGDDILESILARVESNPRFRKVIGPGLKWRGRKCYAEADTCQELPRQPQNRCLFVSQVRRILARFVRDIEMLTSQDFTRNVCCKLDGSSSRFLHELLDVPLDVTGTCKRRKFLSSILREPCAGPGLCTVAEEGSVNAEAKANRRDLVARLLEEYRSLPDDEKKSVEVLGQYLHHELNILNKALKDAAPKSEKAATPVNSQEGGGGNTEVAETKENIGKDSKRAGTGWRTDSTLSGVPITTESANTDETTSYHLGGPLRCRDAAEFQRPFRSRTMWLNKQKSKRKHVKAWRSAKHVAGTVPPLHPGKRSNDGYQEYEAR